MSSPLDFARSEPATALAIAGVLLALLAWLSWRRPTWLFLLALASLAIRPQLLWGGPAVGYGWGLHQTLLMLALLVSAPRFGVRRTPNWPILALLATFCLSAAFGDLHPKLTLPFMLISLAILALPWTFAQVVLEPGSRQKYAMTLALVPLLSVAVGSILHLADVRPLVDAEATGALRLQGAAGIPADLGLLAFGGFALALHESTRTTNSRFTYLGYLNFMIVVLSGTRMAIAASVLLFSIYFVLFPTMRLRWRRHLVAGVLGLGIIVLAVGLYLPNLELRMFGGDGTVALSGRGAMWSFYFDQFLMSPLFGRGLGTGFIAFAEHTSFGLPTPHNEYLHLAVIGGLVGLVLVLAAIAFWFRDVLRQARGDDRVFVCALMPALGLYAVTENLLILPSALPIFVYLGVLHTKSMRDIWPEVDAKTGRLRELLARGRDDVEPRWAGAEQAAQPLHDQAPGAHRLAAAGGGTDGPVL